MTSLNVVNVVVEPTHPMSSSNTKDNNIFRLANGNYISRMAFVYMVATGEVITHRYLSPNESRWALSVKVGA